MILLCSRGRERVTSPLQITGGLLVFFSVSLFLYVKNRALRQRAPPPELVASGGGRPDVELGRVACSPSSVSSPASTKDQAQQQA